MSVLKRYNPTTHQWEPTLAGVQGPQGYQGSKGILAQTSSPPDTGVLWLDTGASADLPTGPQGAQGAQGSQGPQGSVGVSWEREVKSDWDATNKNSYIGIAAKGTSQSAASWNITRINISGSTVTTKIAYSVKWTDRLIATYS